MAKQSEFVSRVLEILTPLGEIRAKPMFGGHGLFLDGTMFALITRADELYLKADDENRPAFENRDLQGYGKMPYRGAPPESLTGWQEMQPWAEGAVAAAGRAQAAKGAKKKRKK
ncbi:MAG: TfoX/Sxy family protein [Alphaproteobacteria bacterium]|jgi:DNA transformation protein|nr:TfoX/Sxy family protein [Alphaproteobacteria bacterium]MDP6622780.1 TfoX/Sxy family protein [Alphaproteobacteria bacterium]|tara:strand:+ start:1057 stop:1398 length:342 start_codon:yes stop_codon:yes gene_type:complete